MKKKHFKELAAIVQDNTYPRSEPRYVDRDDLVLALCDYFEFDWKKFAKACKL